MSVSREQFEQGLTYDAYREQMTRNRERFEANERAVEVRHDDVEAFRAVPFTIRVLVLAEDWCGDVIANLPVLGRLAQETGKLDIRVFPRDQNLDIMDQYLKEGKYRSIPVFVFFGEGFEELGHFIERPESVTERRARARQEIYARHPEFGSPETPIDQLPEPVRVALMEATNRARASETAQDNQDVIAEVRQIVAKVGHR